MKLTTKLLLTAGLTFVLGAPAFATDTTTVKIVNVDCPSTFRIYAEWSKPGTVSRQEFTVPPGTPSDPLQVPSTSTKLGWATIAPATDIVGARRVTLEPGTAITAKFKMYKLKVFGVILAQTCGYTP